MGTLAFVAALVCGITGLGCLWRLRTHGDRRLVAAAMLCGLAAIESGLAGASAVGRVIPHWVTELMAVGLAVAALVIAFSFHAFMRELSLARAKADELERELKRFVQKSSSELRNSEIRFRELAHVAPVGVFETDVQGTLLYASDKWYSVIGMDRRAVESEGWLQAVDPADRERVSTAWHAALQQRGAFHVDCRLQRSDGNSVWVLVQAVPKPNETGERTGFVGTVLDITPTKQIEEERRRQEARLWHTQKVQSLELLAGGVAHDLNNLLTVILGNADLLRFGLPGDSPAHELLRQIDVAGHRAADLAKQMLAYSGKTSISVQPVDLVKLVEGMEGLLRASISHQAVLKFQGSGEAMTKADANQIRQAVLNLVQNASESLGDVPGFIAVSAGLTDVDHEFLSQCQFGSQRPAGRYVSIEVSDTGRGMDAQTLARMFDPFFTTKTAGRGLGLAVVLGIVRSHEGAIRVRSQPSHGATITMLFPVAAEPATVAAPSPSVPAPIPADGIVLVVDDEASVRMVSRRILEAAGHQVLTAVDGLDAIDLFRTHGPRISVVFLDLTMPHLDGLQTLRAIRSIRSDARVVLTSGFAEEDAVPAFADEELAGFIQKPFNSTELVGKLQDVMGNAAR